MWKGQRISVVLPAYNEEQNIKRAVDDFFKIKEVDEVIVVDNNSTDNTSKETKKTKSRTILETRQGYGWALRRGLHEAKGDLILICEPDGSFDAKDLHKFLMYIDEFDVVFGTRTSKSLIWSGAKMDWFLRMGNVVVAKLLEYVHNGPCLTDVGCTMKLIRRGEYLKIKKTFTTGGSDFSPDFMMSCIKGKLRCVEIPVNYKKRIGESKITSNFWKSFKLGVQMIFLILKRKMG